MKNDSYYETDTHIYFWGSCYSQWAMRDIEIDEVTYNCNEQYMMAEKARLFGDEHALNKIMESSDPEVQKAWGRKVKKFEQKAWEKIAKKVVYDANYAKFSQNKDCFYNLKKSGDKEIVEASPYDCIWGVGLRATDPKILDSKNWRGTNWLGEVLTKVREDIEEKQ